MTQVKECDLVMKGGITSGIVYPSLVLQLKDKYHFRNIGGTSAGAIAAAATAAAEYGRDTKDSLGKGGFEKLNDLQNELKKGTFLRDLFQPSAATRPLINVLFDLMDIFKSQRKSKIVKFLGLTKSLLVHLPLIFTTGVFLGMCLSYLLITLVGGSVSGWRIIFPILVGCLTALIVSVINLIFILTRKVPENFIGLCSGRKDNLETEDFTVLTDWLNDRLNDIAGIKGRSKPLTFGDLRCKKFDDNRLTADNITLRMVTSNLSQNQPYVLPFKKDLFIFNRQDFAKLFPPQVLNYLISLDLQKRNDVILPKDYYFLPDADDLPVIVATRMSLSFPILLSAVRLYTIKLEKLLSTKRPLELTADDLQINWFSDGGICSNFPIHFFDSWLPLRPTFGVNLTSMPKDKVDYHAENQVSLDYISPTLSQVNTQPNTDAIYLPKADEPPVTELIPLENDDSLVPNLLRFLGAIFSTAQNYRDNAQSILPSYRERIVQIRLNDDEGGLNLAMTQNTIQHVIDKGTKAGELLQDFKLEPHQWVRFRVVMKLMEANINDMRSAIIQDSIYRKIIDQKVNIEDFPYCCSVNEQIEWLSQISERLKGIGEQVDKWQSPTVFAKEPFPLPEPVLRVTLEI